MRPRRPRAVPACAGSRGAQPGGIRLTTLHERPSLAGTIRRLLPVACLHWRWRLKSGYDTLYASTCAGRHSLLRGWAASLETIRTVHTQGRIDGKRDLMLANNRRPSCTCPGVWSRIGPPAAGPFSPWTRACRNPRRGSRQFSPGSGTVGTKVRIWGQNLLWASVGFNGMAAKEVDSSGPNYACATVPKGARTGRLRLGHPEARRRPGLALRSNSRRLGLASFCRHACQSHS